MTARPETSRSWMQDAACRDAPSRWFTTPTSDHETRQALRICGSCPVREPCLQTALAHAPEADPGIWGGTTEETRHRIRAGELEVDDVRQAQGTRALNGVAASAPPAPADPRPPRFVRPRVTVARDPNGDFTDATGRLLITRLPEATGDAYMLFVDTMPRARTRTLGEAQEAAWLALRTGPALTEPTPRPLVTTEPMRRN